MSQNPPAIIETMTDEDLKELKHLIHLEQVKRMRKAIEELEK